MARPAFDRYMAEINHPSVVAILDHGATEDGTLYMVLDFVEAGDTSASTMVYVDKDSGWLVVWATDGEVKGNG